MSVVRVAWRWGQTAVQGPSEALREAWRAREAVTLAGDYAGDRVFLGYVRSTLDHEGRIAKELAGTLRDDGVTAVYLVDRSRLEGAPLLAAALAAEDADEG